MSVENVVALVSRSCMAWRRRDSHRRAQASFSTALGTFPFPMHCSSAVSVLARCTSCIESRLRAWLSSGPFTVGAW